MATRENRVTWNRSWRRRDPSGQDWTVMREVLILFQPAEVKGFLEISGPTAKKFGPGGRGGESGGPEAECG